MICSVPLKMSHAHVEAGTRRPHLSVMLRDLHQFWVHPFVWAYPRAGAFQLTWLKLVCRNSDRM